MILFFMFQLQIQILSSSLGAALACCSRQTFPGISPSKQGCAESTTTGGARTYEPRKETSKQHLGKIEFFKS